VPRKRGAFLWYLIPDSWSLETTDRCECCSSVL